MPLENQSLPENTTPRLSSSIVHILQTAAMLTALQLSAADANTKDISTSRIETTRSRVSAIVPPPVSDIQRVSIPSGLDIDKIQQTTNFRVESVLNSKKTWAEKFEIFRTTQKIHVGQM
jgi:hypothetical protein